ncbi:MAG: T9SS type A sorting domain-containing protein [Bacteroidota bacterium]
MKKQVLLSLLIMISIVTTATATCVWTGGPMDSWDDDANWSCGHVPAPLDDVIIPAGSTVVVDMAVSVVKITMEGGTLFPAPGGSISTPEFIWEAGTIAVDVTVGVGSDLVMVTTGTKTLDATIFNFGDIAWDAGLFMLNGILDNKSMFGTSFDGTIGFSGLGPGTIINEGVFEKAGGGGELLIKVNMANDGGLVCSSGIIKFDTTADLACAGTIDIAFTEEVNIHCSTTFGPTAVLDGDGIINFKEDTVIIDMAYTGDLDVGFLGAVVELKKAWTVGGTLTLTDGEVAGAGSLTAAAIMDWEGGTLGVSTTTDPASTVTLTGADDKILKSTLTNSGIATWDGGDFKIEGGGLDNKGFFTVKTTSSITFDVTPGTIVNSGTFTVSLINPFVTTTVRVAFSNVLAGTISITLGQLKFDVGGLTNAGTITIVGGGTLDLDHDSTIESTSTLGGTGDIEFSDGAISVEVAYTGALDVTFFGGETTFTEDFNTTGTNAIRGGEILGNATFDVEPGGSLNFSTGTIKGKVQISAGATLTLTSSSDKEITDGTLTNDGTATWSSGDLVISGSGVFDNNNSLTCSFAANLDYFVSEGRGTFNNDGTFTLSTSGVFDVYCHFNNHDKITVTNGSIHFEEGNFENNNEITIPVGSTIEFNNSTDLNTGTSISSGGSLALRGGTLDIQAALSLPNAFSITAGTLTTNATLSTTGPVTMLDGAVTGANLWTISGGLAWSGGSISAPTTNTAASILTLSGTAKSLSATLTNDGTTTWSAGSLTLNAPGVLLNNNTLNITGADSVIVTGTAGHLNNQGTIAKTSTGRTVIQANTTNGGTLGGVGIVERGTVFDNSGGTAAPGNSPGILTFDGHFTNGLRLDIEIMDGTGAGTGHDQLIVTDTATLTGELRVTETGTVPNGSYTILTCQGGDNCIVGTFASTDLPAGYMFSIVNNGTEVVVTKSALPVELIDFTAHQQNKDIVLNWETAAEQNNDFFEIQRSTDAISFTTIGEVYGQGTTDQFSFYSFVDKNILGQINNTNIVYYRLRQNDLDGQFEYSKIVAVQLIEQKLLTIEKMFQGNNGQLNIEFKNLEQLISPQIILFDLSGKLILQKNMEPLNEKTTVQMTIDFIPSGIYVLAIKSGHNYFSEKVFLK